MAELMRFETTSSGGARIPRNMIVRYILYTVYSVLLNSWGEKKKKRVTTAAVHTVFAIN
jgi:hypothetical protein